MTKLFISYRSLDSAKVDQIVTRLRSLKNEDGTPRYDIWQDKTSIPVGQDWWKAIVQGIVNCDVFVFMVSHESVKNPNCRAELSYARKRNRSIIPLVLEDEYIYNDVTGKNDVTYWNDMPHEINDGRFQFLFYEGVRFVRQLSEAIDLLQDMGLRDMPAPEPPDPRNANDITNDTGLIYDQACDAAWRMDFVTAEKLFQRLTDWRDPYFEEESHEWIQIIREYQQMVRFNQRSSTRYRVESMWADYSVQFPKPFTALFDPKDMNSRYNPSDEVQEDSLFVEEPQPIESVIEEPVQVKQPDVKITQPIPSKAEIVEPSPTTIQPKSVATAPTLEKTEQPKSQPVRKPPASRIESEPNRNIPFVPIFVVVGIVGAILLGVVSSSGNSSNQPELTSTTIPSNTAIPSTLSPLDLAKTPVTANDDWTPYEQEFNDVEMVLVPAGCFMMGSDDGNSDEQPVHEQCIEEPFWIDRYEVTNEQFGSIGCSDRSSDPNQPRNCVTWFDAKDFCEANGGRLPSEKEWEYAARGPDNLVYPWGNTYVAENVIGEDDSTYGNNTTAPVGSRSDGASWVGAFDMSGNVWEWTSSLYTESYPYSDAQEDMGNTTSARVLRGGSFNDTMGNLRSAVRNRNIPDDDLFISGFRCVRS